MSLPWPTAPLKRVAGINERSLLEDTDPHFEFRYVDISSVSRGVLVEEPERMRFGDAPSRARRLVRGGDTLVSTVRTYLRAVWPVRGHAANIVASTGFAVLTPRRIDPRFFSWWVSADPFIEEVVARSVGVSYPAINATELGDLPVPLPSREEQAAIAGTLDRETGRLDDLIVHKRSLIDALRERRRSVVFGGSCGLLDDGAVAYDAGLPWTPEIQSPWPKVKIKHVAKLGTGHTPSRSRPEYWEDCTIPWITTGEIQQVRDDRQEVITETREKISELGIQHSSAVLHPKGTVVLCRTASAGFSAIMGDHMATSQDFVTWTCSDRLLPRYLLMCLRAMRSDLLGRLAFGSTHKTVYMPDIEELEIPLPPVEEQREVLAEIDRHLEPIDVLTDRLETQIDRLNEYRQALITAAVTGELDVPVSAV